MTQPQRQHRFAVILAFALVYFFLGIDLPRDRHRG